MTLGYRRRRKSTLGTIYPHPTPAQIAMGVPPKDMLVNGHWVEAGSPNFTSYVTHNAYGAPLVMRWYAPLSAWFPATTVVTGPHLSQGGYGAAGSTPAPVAPSPQVPSVTPEQIPVTFPDVAAPAPSPPAPATPPPGPPEQVVIEAPAPSPVYVPPPVVSVPPLLPAPPIVPYTPPPPAPPAPALPAAPQNAWNARTISYRIGDTIGTAQYVDQIPVGAWFTDPDGDLIQVQSNGYWDATFSATWPWAAQTLADVFGWQAAPPPPPPEQVLIEAPAPAPSPGPAPAPMIVPPLLPVAPYTPPPPPPPAALPAAPQNDWNARTISYRIGDTIKTAQYVDQIPVGAWFTDPDGDLIQVQSNGYWDATFSATWPWAAQTLADVFGWQAAPPPPPPPPIPPESSPPQVLQPVALAPAAPALTATGEPMSVATSPGFSSPTISPAMSPGFSPTPTSSPAPTPMVSAALPTTAGMTPAPTTAPATAPTSAAPATPTTATTTATPTTTATTTATPAGGGGGGRSGGGGGGSSGGGSKPQQQPAPAKTGTTLTARQIAAIAAAKALAARRAAIRIRNTAQEARARQNRTPVSTGVPPQIRIPATGAPVSLASGNVPAATRRRRRKAATSSGSGLLTLPFTSTQAPTSAGATPGYSPGAAAGPGATSKSTIAALLLIGAAAAFAMGESQ